MDYPAYDPTQLPSGLDWADGQAGRPGTVEQAGQVLIQGPGGSSTQPLEEEPGSPEIERGDQCTIKHAYTGSWAELATQITGIGRGTVRTDSYGNVTRVLSATLKRLNLFRASMQIVEESISFDTPIEKFDICPVDLGLSILKHPRYWYALYGANATEYAQNQMVIRALQDYMENPSFPYRNAIPLTIYNSLGHADGAPSSGVPTLFTGTDLAKRAALEIIQKFWRNEETPYITGLEVTHSMFFFRPPGIDLGGRVEDPILDADPPIPAFFWYDQDGYPITRLIARLNPQCYSTTGTAAGLTSISWLRKADRLHYERTWFQLDRTWIGSPVGFWDPELYSAAARPSSPNDYLAMDVTKMPDYRS